MGCAAIVFACIIARRRLRELNAEFEKRARDFESALPLPVVEEGATLIKANDIAPASNSTACEATRVTRSKVSVPRSLQ
jgi:hypothetical protein